MFRLLAIVFVRLDLLWSSVGCEMVLRLLGEGAADFGLLAADALLIEDPAPGGGLQPFEAGDA